MRRFILILAITGFFAAPAKSQRLPNAGNMSCDEQAYRTEWVTRIIDSFDKLISPLERPSPTEIEWFEKESESLLEHQISARWRLVEMHRMYHPWQAQRSHQRARSYLYKALEKNLKKEQTKILISFLSNYAEFSTEFYSYLSADIKREVPVVSKEIKDDMYIEIQRIRMLAQRLGECIVDRMKE